MAKNVKKLFALILTIAMVMSLSVNAFAAEGDISLDKTADWSDEKYVADVTLSVGGEAEVIGSDIIYIVGSYASNSDGTPNPKGDVLISSLMDTITEMVEAGTVVNFGMVPFSSDSVIAMELTPISEENLADMPNMIADALATCESTYDGVNMENALVKAKKMFEESDLADYPERQHLVMISSGFTYFFNSGKNNENVATVPVNYVGVDRLFYWNKAWQRARTNQTNTYPIPKGIVEAYEADDEDYDTLWDFYWSYIDQWVNDDIDAGDKVVYDTVSVESGEFLTWYSSGEVVSGYSQTGYGKAIPTDEVTDEQLANAVTLTAGANPLTDEAAAHAIGYERAMWEAYEYAQDYIVDEGINFYPIYNALNANYTNGNWSPSSYNVSWTNQYIGHSFMDMLAGGEAVKYESQGDKTFFAPIKNKIMKSVAAGSYVDDYMGYGDEYDFDFIDELGKITLKVGLNEYTTTKMETPTEGFDSSYAFTAPEATEPTFWLDYVKGNGTSDEMFRWTYGEDAYDFAPVVLDYQVRLVASPAVLVDDLVCETNKIATLYPEGGDPEEFPVPEVKLEPVTYTVTYIDRDEEVQYTDDLATGDEIPGCEDPESYTQGSYKYTFKKWKLIEGKEGADGTIGTTDLVYESVYSRSKTGKPITPSNPEIEIPDDEIPLAEIPELFGDDHYAYIIGYPDGMVHPEGKITRAEVATIFFRLLAEDVRTALMTDVNDFSDVEKGQWYNHAVSTLSSIGVILGRSDGSFDPNAYITRAEFAAIAARFDPTGNPEGVFFTDIAGHWAEREIIIAANNGWVEGYNGLFRPNDYITRAEAMTLVNRVLHRLPETEHDLLEYMVTWPDNMDVNVWYYLAVQEATNSHDYVRKTDPIYESWTEFIEPYDWSQLEY